MNILGLQFGHDAGAVVLRDGHVASFVLRERLSRIKHAMSLDWPTIERALSDAGIDESDIDYCAITSTQKTELIARDPNRISVNLERHPAHSAPCSFADIVARGGIELDKLLYSFVMDVLYRRTQGDPASHSVSHFFPEYQTVPEHEFFKLGWLDTYITADPWARRPRMAELGTRDYSRFLQTDVIRHGFHYPATLVLNGRRIPAYFISHHMAHAASIYYQTGLDRAAILTHDGFGGGKSYHTGMYYFGDGHRIYPLAPHHLVAGAIYELAGIRLGLGLVGPAGKVMGLAPYGEPKFFTPDFVGNWFDLVAKGKANPAEDWVKHCVTRADLMGYDKRALRNRAQMTAPINADIAASTQKLFEETILAAVRSFHELLDRLGLGALPLCYSGGTALNCPANSMIAETGMFSAVHVPPWCDDSGLALGAALALHHNIFDQPLVPNQWPAEACLGIRHDESDVERLIPDYSDRLKFERRRDWAEAAAGDLAANKVIGWFEGRSEIGPRALGHRSILADARQPENWAKVNRIKQREAWRPFAPAVLADRAAEWFEGMPMPSPYMLFTAQLKSDALPATTHVDGSARVQSVDESRGAFHGLLRRFDEITGVPVILNTSFNGPGEPIVETPEDAIRFFLESELEALYLSGWQVIKK
ncbi:MAG: carbamoyltransferase C-terminal domain-containing protein [Dongiaceae bacterium]